MTQTLSAMASQEDPVVTDNDIDKDALPITIRTLKQVISRHWPSMANADLDLVIRAIKDPACLHL